MVQEGEARSVRQDFRPDVEGLRAVAILLVVLYHVHVRLFSGGYVGVDVFFVISGFLITGQLTRELDTRGRISFLGFYARRARRILPAASLVTIATVVASSILLTPLAARRLFDDALAAIFFGVNFRLASQGANYFDNDLPPSPLQHFWSLSVEEQFYVVWPLLLILSSLVWFRARSRSRKEDAPGDPEADRGTVGGFRRPDFRVVVGVLAVVAVVSFGASLYETPRSPSWAYYSILTRAWELAAGALTALALPLAARLGRRVAPVLAWLGLVGIALAATLFGATTPYPGHAALLPVAGAVAVIVGGSAMVADRGASAWGAEMLLGTAPFQRIGSWSYSWYLWHWPALILVPVAVGHPLSVPEGLAVAAASLVVAVASYVFVERPLRRMQFAVRRPVLGLAGGGMLAVVSVVVVLVSGTMLPALAATGPAARPALARTGKLTAAQLSADLVAGVKTTKVPSNLTPPLSKAANSLPLIVTNGCHLQHGGTKSKPCIYGDTTSTTSVVLFGDSHAAAWFPALQLISKQQHWRLVDITKAGCPPVEVNIIFNGKALYTQCAEWRRNAEAQIAALHPALVIAAWARYLEEPEAKPLAGVPTTYGTTWQDGVAAIFSFLHRSAQHVVFMSDGPTLSQLAPDCVSGHLSDVYPCTTARSVATRFPVVKSQELALAKAAHIVSIDPTSWFCTPTRCPVIVGNILLYRDEAHMVPAWSQFIAPVWSAALVPVVDGTLTSAAHRSTVLDRVDKARHG
jgi:peptidoglycan/LPS O-acetylase OafA/YrhL